MQSAVREAKDGARAAAGAVVSMALLAAVSAGTLVVLSLVLVTLIVPFVFPLVLLSIAGLTRLEEARLARVYVRSS